MAQLTIQQAFDLAVQHHQAGRLRDAEQIYRQILASQPSHAEATHYLGVLAHQAGRNDVAVDLIRRAIALRPNYAQAYNNLGSALKDQGQLDEAITAWRAAITFMPALAEAHHNLGTALRDQKQYDQAIAALHQAIALRPNYAEAHLSLGNALKENGQLDDAIAAYRQAIAARPDYVEAHSNLGTILKDKGDLDGAIAALNQAIASKPGNAAVYSNLGATLMDQDRLDEGIVACRQAVAADPHFPEGHYNLAMALLARGHFQEGWEEYQWRSKCKSFKSPIRNFAQPQWDGCPLDGRTILLHAEQGFGDTIQFIRYLPLAIQRAGKVVVQCQPELLRLFQTIGGEFQIVDNGHPPPAFDFHCPLLSLPRAFGTTLDNVPATVQYLFSEVQAAGRWQKRIDEYSPMMKVGLAWAGNPAYKNDRNRSTNLAMLAPLGQVSGVHFFSLQKGNAANQTSNPPPSMKLIDWTAELNDFADTAALIANLDLVITTDTAIPHLAGAMGKPVWTMLPFNADWRWLADREDSPWYPSMRLFRQPARGDWAGAIHRVVDALKQYSQC